MDLLQGYFQYARKRTRGGGSYRIVLNVDLQFYINVLFIVIYLELTPFIMLHDAGL